MNNKTELWHHTIQQEARHNVGLKLSLVSRYLRFQSNPHEIGILSHIAHDIVVASFADLPVNHLSTHAKGCLLKRLPHCAWHQRVLAPMDNADAPPRCCCL